MSHREATLPTPAPGIRLPSVSRRGLWAQLHAVAAYPDPPHRHRPTRRRSPQEHRSDFWTLATAPHLLQ